MAMLGPATSGVRKAGSRRARIRGGLAPWKARRLVAYIDAHLGEGVSVAELSCGLCDQPHLSKVFRDIVGETPSAWRRVRCALPHEMIFAPSSATIPSFSIPPFASASVPRQLARRLFIHPARREGVLGVARHRAAAYYTTGGEPLRGSSPPKVRTQYAGQGIREHALLKRLAQDCADSSDSGALGQIVSAMPGH
jgi:hypothetical protein